MKKFLQAAAFSLLASCAAPSTQRPVGVEADSARLGELDGILIGINGDLRYAISRFPIDIQNRCLVSVGANNSNMRRPRNLEERVRYLELQADIAACIAEIVND